MVTPNSTSTQAPAHSDLPGVPGLPGSPASEPAGLTIGDLADRTGLTPATLRMWEARHGFQRPRRLASGHRRYDEHDVDLVRAGVRRRASGAGLEVPLTSVALARATEPPGPPSVHATMRRLHPDLHPQRLKKSTLLAMSW